MSGDRLAWASESTIEWAPPAAGRRVQTSLVARDRVPVVESRMVAGRYRVSHLLGTGGMGAVWLAQDDVLRRAVALKKVADEDREDMSSALREARAAARVTHPGVVRVHDVVVGEEGDWIVMEALRGDSLATTIRERGRLSVDSVAQIATQLLSALEAIHAAGLVHRDVKPGNVQLCEEGRVVLTDFGLSSPHGVWGGVRAGSIAGSLPYLAPESILDGHFGPASDLYALGVTLYKAVEGRHPFDSVTSDSLLESGPPRAPEPARYAGSLGEVLDGLLEQDPARRMDAARARSHLQSMGVRPDHVVGWMSGT